MTTIRLKKRQAVGQYFAKFSAEERLKMLKEMREMTRKLREGVKARAR